MAKRYFVGICQHNLPFEMKNFCIKDLQTENQFGAKSIEDLPSYFQDMQDEISLHNITFTLPARINDAEDSKFGNLPVAKKFHEMSPKEIELFKAAIK